MLPMVLQNCSAKEMAAVAVSGCPSTDGRLDQVLPVCSYVSQPDAAQLLTVSKKRGEEQMQWLLLEEHPVAPMALPIQLPCYLNQLPVQTLSISILTAQLWSFPASAIVARTRTI